MKPKKRVKKQSPSIILKSLLNMKSIRLLDVKSKLDISYPTVRTFMADPSKLNGYQRKQFANLAGVSIDTIDDIINGKFADINGVLTGTRANGEKTDVAHVN